MLWPRCRYWIRRQRYDGINMLWTLNVSRATLQFCSQQLLNVCTVIAQLCHCPQAFVEHQTLIEHDPSTIISRRLLAGQLLTRTQLIRITLTHTAHWQLQQLQLLTCLGQLSCRPFCRYHCLTSVVHSVKTDSQPSQLSAHMARWSCVASAYWWCHYAIVSDEVGNRASADHKQQKPEHVAGCPRQLW